MTNLDQIERKFNMFSRARKPYYVGQEGARAHRWNLQNLEAMTVVLQTNRDTILEAVRDCFEQRGYDRRIPYGFSNDRDCCPMACKLGESVDGGEDFPVEIRLFVAGFDRGIFPEFDIGELELDDRLEFAAVVFGHEVVYPPDEI